MAAIRIEAVHKRFGASEVLRDVSLDIADGEFLSLVGPSGCGKSTLLRILAGLEEQSAGRVVIGGAAVDHLRPRDRDLAMVFQSYALYPHLSVADNISVPLRQRKTGWAKRLPLLGQALPGQAAQRRAIDAKVRDVAEQLAIAPLLARKPSQLSGGQRQRVALARAIVRSPRAFLMDEPLSNLDAKLRVSMRAEIAQLHRRLGATFVYVTHDQAEAMTMSDRIAVMMDGRLLQVDTPEAIYKRPAEVRVARFIGSPGINLLPGRIRSDGGVELTGRSIGLSAEAAEGLCQVGIRPEHLRLAEPGATARLVGKLLHSEYLGSEILMHVGLDGRNEPLIARCQAAGSVPAIIDSEVRLGFAPADALVFDGNSTAVATFAGRRLEQAHG